MNAQPSRTPRPHLNGEQPVTSMRIVRENDRGGRFFAPIAVNGKLVFKAVAGGSGKKGLGSRKPEVAVYYYDTPECHTVDDEGHCPVSYP